jgi:eukaryotic-like serine/threonine-protein kinase
VQWSQHGFHVQHYNHMLGVVHVELYSGTPERAWNHLDEKWPALEKSLLLRVELVRHEARVARARSALAAAHRHPNRERLLEIAAHDIKALRKENVTWAMAWSDVLSAALAHARGNREGALAELVRAEESFVTVDMPLHAACARRRRGQLAGDPSLVQSADQWMTTQKIANPARMSDVMASGFSPEE